MADSSGSQVTTGKIKFFQSLRFKMSLFITLMMVVVLIILSAVFVISEQKRTTNNALRNGETFAIFSSDSIYASYTRNYTHPTPEDFTNFKVQVQNVLDFNKDVIKVSLVSLNGRILFDSDEFQSGKYTGSSRTVDDETTLKELRNEKVSTRDTSYKDENVTEIIVPLQEGGTGHILSMRYLLSYKSIPGQMKTVYSQILSVSSALTIFVIAIAVLFSLALVRPISRLTLVAEKLRGGDFDARAEATAKDEIGVLGRTLNEMASKLKSYYEELEQKVRERTKALEEAEKQLEEVNVNLEHKVVERTEELTETQGQLIASIRSLPFGFAAINKENQIVFTNELFGKLVDRKVPLGENKESAKALQEISKSFESEINLLECINESQSKDEAIEKNITFGSHFYRFFFMPVTVSNSGKKEISGSVLIMEDTTEEKALQRSRDEFFSIASHELRTPLTGIRGNSGMILEYYQEVLKDPGLKEMVQDIHGASLRLINIVNDFLNMSRLEQGKIKFENTAFDLVAVAQQTLREYEVTGSRKKLSLDLNAPKEKLPLVYGDSDRSRQILVNLIGNGLKFTEEGGITLDLKVQEKTVKLTVTDTGKGISEKYQHLLFHKFQQASDSILTRDNTQSTGLGLYISKMLAESMNGKLYLEHTEEGKGSTFSFELPLANKEQIAAASILKATAAPVAASITPTDEISDIELSVK